jgi:polysaccharide export outer membrane protein
MSGVHGWVWVVAMALLSLAGCALDLPAAPAHDASVFKPAVKSDRVAFLDATALAELEAQIEPIYRLGAGDQINLQVIGRPDISGRLILGPDGVVTVPVAGQVTLEALTRSEAATAVRKALDRYYVDPFVQVGVEAYTSFRITVMGRVQVPGQLAFDKPPTLLEVLAKAGSLPVIDKQATLTRCAVFRGRDRIIWVDLKRLFNGGETAYNIRLVRGDVIYIPDSSDTMVYVLGAVTRPGAYRLTPDMSLMDALSQAGGPNEDGNQDEIGVYRPSRQLSERVRLRELMTATRRANFGLEEGDVIYVPKTGVAEFGYFTRNLAAGLSFMTVGAALTK